MKRTGILLLLVLCLVPVCAQVDKAEKDLLAKLYKQAGKLYRSNDTNNAAAVYRQYLEQCGSEAARQTFEYTDVMARLASIANGQGDFNRAITLGEEVVRLRRKAVGEQWPGFGKDHLAGALQNVSVYYSQKGDYDTSIRLSSESVDLYRQFDKKKEFYPVALCQLATCYLSRGETEDFGKAEALTGEAVKLLDKGSIDYANALNNLAICYTRQGNSTAADKVTKEAVRIWNKKFGDNSMEYAKVLNNQAIRLSRIRKFREAFEMEEQALKLMADRGLDSTYNYAKLLLNYAKFNEQAENYEKSIELYKQALPVIERTVGRQRDYIRGMSELSAAYYHTGNLEEAEKWAMASINCDIGSSTNPVYIAAFRHQARTFADNANYRKAIGIETNVLNAFHRIKDSLNIAVSLDNLGNYYYHADSIGKTFEISRQALDIFARNAPASLSYAQALNNVSVYHYNSGNYDKAASLGKQAVSIYEAQEQTESSIYAKILGNVALYSTLSDSIDTAIRYSERAYSIQKRILGEDHPDNALMCYNLANSYFRKGDYDNVRRYFSRALNLQSAVVRSNFSHLTTEQREAYWNRKNYIFKVSPVFAFQASECDSLVIDAYNAMLFTKGILLNSEVDFKKLLLSTGNTELLQKYNRVEVLQKEKNACYGLSPAERDSRLAAIEDEVVNLEKALVRGCKEYGDFTDNLSIDFSRVASALRPEDVAIEFVDLEVEGAGTTWLALVLRKEWKAPRLVRLFNRDRLSHMDFGGLSFFEALRENPRTMRANTNRIYNDTLLGRMVWQPLIEAWGDGVRNVYFAPTSLFYHLGVEYLLCDGQHRIGDLYSVNRLSSTKLLARKQGTARPRHAFVYGGLNYDIDAGELLARHEQYAAGYSGSPTRSLGSDDGTLALDSLITRGGVNYLIGTREEVDSIIECLMMHGINTRVFLEDEGTEESFKSMKNPGATSVIHIATHGFCYSEADVLRRAGTLSFLQEEKGTQDNSLNYSGLLLSGANHVLGGKPLPQGVENGILTAKEISQLDLNWASLVVLSACQTGLGEVRDDGVFGLQRGFKKAGARTLLMSLWSVDDNATRAMMTQFYSRLVQGMSCQEAFRQARQTLRETPEYSEPYFWASFIMLDGID